MSGARKASGAEPSAEGVGGEALEEAATLRLVGALMLEQNDEWAVQHRDMSLEHLAQFGDGEPVKPPGVGR